MIHDNLASMSTEHIKNMIWGRVSQGQPLPSGLTVDMLRDELVRRGVEPKGFHNT